MRKPINFEIIDGKNLIGAKQGDIVTLKKTIDSEHVMCIDKGNRDVLLKLSRLKYVWCCNRCHYTYDQRGNCKCLRV